MSSLPPKRGLDRQNRPRVLIFYSDTGGGHRAAANALRDAFELRFPGRYEVILTDGFKDCAPFPFNYIPSTYYPIITYLPRLWGWGFHITNSPALLPLTAAFDDFILRAGCARAIRQVDPAIVISVHPLINRPPRNALAASKRAAAFVTVVTDLLDAHGMWFAAASDLVSVPTPGAFERGLAWQFPRERMRVIGQPIALKFAAPTANETTAELRARLNLKPNCFTILLVGGGEGMGPLAAIAQALDKSALPIQLVIIAGRNQTLRERLEAIRWQSPVSVQGFVTNMPEWMRASDLLITKAGPGTIMEALAAGKPLILSGNLPGQEEGNVTFVEQAGVGVLRTTPEAIAAQVRAWLSESPHELEAMKIKAQGAARPTAALEIVETIAQTFEARSRSVRLSD
jgi:1,2-diacylglycerol 3-beta-galactosyltransferase